ncbi:MAG: DUF59 domain-containing protein [Deltaproteobacteria bacterium]|nr:DUF59 domain-containing protein [Deltaproteobacteria bacterium]MBW2122512.1 DUF59 domain-containing protein [Deltaproteobacteria bacterium]
MGREISEDDVRKALEGVSHPFIDRTLFELGIIRSTAVEGNRAKITLAFPFPNIPIKDQLMESVREPVANLGAEVEVELTVMNQEELQRFLVMEQDAWKGDGLD